MTLNANRDNIIADYAENEYNENSSFIYEKSKDELKNAIDWA
jgi:hypothetical protein